MLAQQSARNEAFSLAKRPAEDSSQYPCKSPRLAAPSRIALLATYSKLKHYLHMNVELAVKHDLTKGLKLHEDIFGTDWNGPPNLNIARRHPITTLAKRRAQAISTKVMAWWFGNTPEEQDINMEVLNFMTFHDIEYDKQPPEIVYLCAAPGSNGVTQFLSLEHAKQLYKCWGRLRSDEIEWCKGGLDELSARATAILVKYHARISEGGKDGIGYRKDCFLRFYAGYKPC